MEPFRDDNELIAELRTLRPEPTQEFAAELDECATAGFPRRSSRVGAAASRLRTRIQTITPRRALIPMGATALAAVVAATVIVDQQGGNSTSPEAHNSAAIKKTQYSGAATRKILAPMATEAIKPQGGFFSKLSHGAFNGSGGYIQASENLNASVHLLRRDIERSAEIVLGADPAEVGRDASRVFEAVHANRGIVLHSSIRDGSEGEAGARFDLLIPSARLGDALAALSTIAEVRSRHDATADITAPTVRTGELVRDSRAKIDSLLAQLSRADSEGERAAVEAQLRAERRQNARLRSQLSTLQRRANLSRVSLRIETGAPSTSSDDSDGGWGVGDALHDAGHILTIAAGVAIVGLAILAPLILIALLAWLANRARLRRARERALV